MGGTEGDFTHVPRLRDTEALTRAMVAKPRRIPPKKWRDPPQPVELVIEPGLDDPFPDYDHEPVFAENWQPEEQ